MNLDELMKKHFSDVIKDNPTITEEVNTIFEGSVSEKVAEKLVEKETELEKKNEADLKIFKESIVEKLDEYITLSVEEFTEENKTNIETGLKVMLAEKTFTVVKELFTEAGISIPEDQKTIVVDLEKKVEDLSNKLNESVNSEIDSKKQIFEYNKSLKFITLSADLSESKKEKLMNLVENISCGDNIEDFEKKLIILKETISDKKEDKKDKTLLEDDNFEAGDLDKYLP